MPSTYARGNRIWCRVKIAGRWKSEPTPFNVGDEARAERFATAAQAAIDKREAAAAAGDAAALSLAAYAERWLQQRRELGVRSVDNESARLRLATPIPSGGRWPPTPCARSSS